jgi:conjugative relaxase-like TrwC/TraI family protein
MMSLRGLGNLGSGSGAASLAATYYEEHSADYYVKDLDHQGQWMGQGAQRLGLEGAVDRSEFQLSLAGFVADHEVQNAGKENRQMGWDCTFSAPKSVSIVWAGADTQQKQNIELAHQRAVEAAFKYLEDNTFTRRGHDGEIHEPAKLVASRFNHYTSREGDPQLHSHVVISNFSVRDDGSVGTIGSRTFYENKMTAGALYQVELAYQMKEMGYEIEQGAKGTFRLSDVSKEAEHVFSKRDQQIDALAKEREIYSYAGTRGIVLATRAQKVICDLSEREETWGREAKENGVDLSVGRNRLDNLESKVSDEEILTEAGEKLTQQHSTFKEKDLLRQTAVASFGSRNAEEVRGMTAKARELGVVKELENGLLTTPDMAKIEQGIMERVDRMTAKANYAVSSLAVIERGIEIGGKQLPFSREQQWAITTATEKSAIAVIQGRAGTGKSSMLCAVRECYESAGWKVQGIALAGVAAENLKQGSGIESRTIASWVSQKENELSSRSVVVLDEAGMVGSKQMSEVIERIQDAGAKLVLVGDEKQLQPIAAGGILHSIDRHIAQTAPEYSTSIENIQRQREGWMKETVKLAAQGKTGEALEKLDEKGKINFYQNSSEARAAVVDEYIKANKEDFSKGIVLTSLRQDADKINVAVREKLLEQGLINKRGIEFNNLKTDMNIAKGDRIMFTSNDYKLDVRNGQRATIESATDFDGHITAVLDNGQRREFNIKDYQNIDYGWASTTHKAQGATVERAIVYGFSGESMASQQATYVQISRAKAETKLFIVAGERGVEREGQAKLNEEQKKEALKEMKQSWSHDAAKDTTLEHTQLRQNREEKLERGYERSL